MVFDSISSNIDEVLLINQSANEFVFGDFNIHDKDWLTYFGGTDTPVNSVIIFFISNGLTQMVNFPTQICDCKSLMPAFVLQWLSHHWEILIMLLSQFPLTFQEQDAQFHRIAYDHSCADWDGLCDHLRDLPWEDIFKVSASAAASEFRE